MRKSKKLKQKKAKCLPCDRVFVNAGALGTHNRKIHPPPPPDVIEFEIDREGMVDGLEVAHTLLGGTGIRPGDVFYRVEKLVVMGLKHKKVNGIRVASKDAVVLAKVIRQHWQENKPI